MDDHPIRAAALVVRSSTAASLTTIGVTCGTAFLGIQESPIVQRPPDDHPLYALIGRVASTWTHLEHTLDLIIWELAGIAPEKDAGITAQMMGAGNRFKTIISLLRQRQTDAFAKLADEADALMRKSYGPQEDRNRIVHDAWYIYADQTSQFRAMAPKDQRFGVCLVDLAKIEQTIASAEKLNARAGTLWREIHAALASSP